MIQCRRAFLWLTLTKAAWDYLVVPLLLWLTPIEGWNAVILWEVQPAIGSVVLLFYALQRHLVGRVLVDPQRRLHRAQ